MKEKQQALLHVFVQRAKCDHSVAQYYLETYRWNLDAALKRYEMDCKEQLKQLTAPPRAYYS